MKILWATVVSLGLLSSALPASEAGGDKPTEETLIRISYVLPASNLKITVDSKGVITRQSESRGCKAASENIRISEYAFGKLKMDLESIDWPHIAKDKVIGLDGMTVEIKYRTYNISIWTPKSEYEKRGLGRLLEVIAEIFDLAGLEPSGLPKAK